MLSPPTQTRAVEGMKSQSKSVEGELTREALVGAAEELFARYGPEGVSIRSVNSAAGVASAATHYHFGSKDALVYAVLRRRGQVVVNRYFQLLDELDSKDSPTPRDLVEVFAKPLIELIEEDPVGGLRWLKFVAQLAQSRDVRLQRATTGPGSINERFSAAVSRVLRGAPTHVALMRWQIAASALLRLLATADMPGGRLPGDSTTGVSGEYVEAIVDFATAGLEGPHGGARLARRDSAQGRGATPTGRHRRAGGEA
jgi:AcrR family transcriptional regulator